MRWKLAEWNEERDDSPATFRELNSAGRKSLRSVNNTVNQQSKWDYLARVNAQSIQACLEHSTRQTTFLRHKIYLNKFKRMKIL